MRSKPGRFNIETLSAETAPGNHLMFSPSQGKIGALSLVSAKLEIKYVSQFMSY